MENDPELSVEQKYLSRIGLSVFLLVVLTAALQVVITFLFFTRITYVFFNTWMLYALFLLPQYLIAMPVAVFLLKSVPKNDIPIKDFKPRQFLVIFLISCFCFYGGNLIGSIVSMILSALTGSNVSNAVVNLISDSDIFANLIVFVIIGPIVEELFYRKLLMGRLVRYGERVAVLTSALIFALIHGNLSQLFYAYGLGLVLGYMYVKTGTLIYPIILHTIINSLGVVIGPAIIDNGAALTMVYSLFVYGSLVAGLTLFITNRKQIRFEKGPFELPNWKHSVFLNTGMILFLFACIAMILLNTASSLA